MSSEEIVKLIDLASNSSQAYTNLETLCICYPGRISGSGILESALDFLSELGSEKMGLRNLRQETVKDVPNWVRGNSDEEKLFVEIDPSGVWPVPNPTKRVFRIMANGMSPGTTGVTGNLISVASIADLKALGAEEVAGKVVLLDYGVFPRMVNCLVQFEAVEPWKRAS